MPLYARLMTPKRKRVFWTDPMTPELSPTKKLWGCAWIIRCVHYLAKQCFIWLMYGLQILIYKHNLHSYHITILFHVPFLHSSINSLHSFYWILFVTTRAFLSPLIFTVAHYKIIADIGSWCFSNHTYIVPKYYNASLYNSFGSIIWTEARFLHRQTHFPSN